MRRTFFLKKNQKDLAARRSACYSLRMEIATNAADAAALELEIEKEMQRISAMTHKEFADEFLNGNDYPYGEYDPYEDYNWRDDR